MQKRLGKIIDQLAQYRTHWEGLMHEGSSQHPFERSPGSTSRLTEIKGFGSNPGNLRMLTYVPGKVAPDPALVVVLHGCTQTAEGYDHGSGWSALADRHGFILLYPEQQDTNNPKRCFNWFQPEDVQRGRGEVLSIRQMIERAATDHGVGRRRVFVTGLSAGGAMTAAMLATYPEVFAGGAIVAGLPYGSAASVPEAFEAMFKGRSQSDRAWGDLVRGASQHQGPWPRVSVWHGSADRTVQPMNSHELTKQWTNVHGLSQSPGRQEVVDGYPRRVWTNAAGEDVIEEYVITGMAHGTPLATGAGENSYGNAGPFLLEVGISSSYHIAKFWGLTESEFEVAVERPAVDKAPATTPASAFEIAPRAEPRARRHEGTSGRKQGTRLPSSPADIGSIINKALKAAGLMK